MDSVPGRFSALPPGERVAALRRIIAGLSPYEAAIARRELLAARGPLAFDVVGCLPRELACMVFGLLDPLSLSACAQVNWHWRGCCAEKSVVGEVVRRAALSRRLPEAPGGAREQLRRLLECEWRWAGSRPAMRKETWVFSGTAALAAGHGWAAASFGQRLQAWSTAGGDAVQRLDVYSVAQKSLAICPSGAALAAASYLRTAAVYSLADGAEQFSLRREAGGFEQADILGEHLALWERGNTVNIYEWTQRRHSARLALGAVAVHRIALCSRDWLAVVSAGWSIHFFRVADGSPAFAVEANADMDAAAIGRHDSDPVRIKAAMYHPTVARIALYNSAAWVTLDVDMRAQRARNVVLRHAGPGARILDAHFDHMLVAVDDGALGGHIVRRDAAGQEHRVHFGRPKGLAAISPRRAAIGTAVLSDDAVLGASSMGRLVLMRFAG
ncbi:hypothetical protein H4R18_001675 [Coemansia javaensis]|uniref:F-box domain-containing protein n=1 Tax=Coemansia javaensis TaxID=2761396 RepID=A0A9W8LIT7_9FUNG|nr:hypothetical protein H4R18_001675 [Coemansia javaensis]